MHRGMENYCNGPTLASKILRDRDIRPQTKVSVIGVVAVALPNSDKANRSSKMYLKGKYTTCVTSEPESK